MSATDQLVGDCRAALAEDQAPLAIKEVLARAMATGRPLAGSTATAAAGLNILHRAPDLTVVDAIWPPLMSLFPHDHRMWAVIAIYGGQEDNTFYRRQGESIATSGGRELLEGDVLVLGAETIHGVRNPRHGYTGAIHVYGGDFVGTPRSQWDQETLQERPYDFEAVQREFERAQDTFGPR
jgi:predicted metal-dependent enzyme (double-stranded beta helix superfamily)